MPDLGEARAKEASAVDAVGELGGVTFGWCRRRSLDGVDETVRLCSIGRSG